MLHKVMKVIKAMMLLYVISPEKMTVGEIARWTHLPYSSVKRYLEIARNSELVECEKVAYKTTGKYVYWTTEKGLAWLDGYRGMEL